MLNRPLIESCESPSTERSAVVVFARAASEDARRWRLAGSPGYESSSGSGSANVSIRAHQSLLNDTLRKVSGLRSSNGAAVDVLVFHHGELEGVEFPLEGVRTVLAQRGADFGARLSDAVARTFERGYDRVVVVGTDVPHLRRGQLRRATESLANRSVVLGEDTGGGCYLIGLRRETQHLLDGVTWQAGSDFDQLCRLACESIEVLPEVLDDLDGSADLQRVDTSGLAGSLLRDLLRLRSEVCGVRVEPDRGWRWAGEDSAALQAIWLQPRSSRGPPTTGAVGGVAA